MFTLIQSSPLEITLDPIAAEERLPSAAFDITADWIMSYQQARIVIKECWLEYSELNRFEKDLKILLDGQIENAELKNMSLEPIMSFRRNGKKFDFEFNASDTAKMGTVSIKTDLYKQELIEIIQNIKDWAKWW